MIRDLAAGATAPAQAEIVVVGAGIAGTILAVTLARRGKRVVVLESGPREQGEGADPLNAIEQSGVPYAGALEGRFRGLGGTSTRWGGALIPFVEADLTQHPPGWDSDWLGLHGELARYVPAAEALFGLPPGPYEEARLATLPLDGGPAFLPRSAKWPPFARRNVAHLFARDLQAENGPEVILNATVDRFRFRADGALEGLGVVAPNGTRVEIQAGAFVLAPGAIEATRLLLLADRSADQRIFAPHDVLGRYFHDHLSAPTHQLRPKDRTGLNRLAGFRFEGKAMRNVRFEAAAALRARERLPASFSHIGFETERPGGFDVLRDILRAVQRRRMPGIGLYGQLVRQSPWLARAAWWKIARKRLLFPNDARLLFHVVVEQRPDRDSRITLGDRLDRHGAPLARIDWRIGRDDVEALRRTGALLAEAWGASPYAALAEMEPAARAIDLAMLSEGGGIFHPGGSTRIGATRESGVLDRDLSVFGIPNLSVAATSAFPSGGGANPTMMLVLAALRLADRLAPAA